MKAANEAKPAAGATPVIFDTLKAAQALRKTGFEDRQAEAVVETISKAVSETVATKTDLQLVRSEMATKEDLQSLEQSLRSEMATKADLQSLEQSLRSEMATKADLRSVRSEMATKADLRLVRSEMATKEDLQSVRSEMATKADLRLVKSEMATKAELQLLEQSVDSRFDKIDSRFDTLEKSLRQDMAAQENRIVLKLGGLMVTMLFLLLAIGPFYIRWVMSLLGSP